MALDCCSSSFCFFSCLLISEPFFISCNSMYLICSLLGIQSFTTLPAIGDDDEVSYAIIGDLGTLPLSTLCMKATVNYSVF